MSPWLQPESLCSVPECDHVLVCTRVPGGGRTRVWDFVIGFLQFRPSSAWMHGVWLCRRVKVLGSVRAGA